MVIAPKTFAPQMYPIAWFIIDYVKQRIKYMMQIMFYFSPSHRMLKA